MVRKPCCEKVGMNRGAWTAMEDKILTDYISLNGEGKWRNLPINAGLKRCGKSCRLRWLNYLRPDIKRGNITREEEDLIIRLHKLLGNRWSLIAGRLPGRTDNEIKNYWNTNISKKLQCECPTAHDQNKRHFLSSLRFHDQPKKKLPTVLTYAVRTKATRCTRVIIPKELQNIDPKNNDGIAKNTSEIFEQGPMWARDESTLSNLKMDVDMHDHILSNVEEVNELFPFPDLEQHQQHQQQNEGELISSPFRNDNLFFDEDMHGELDTDWITSFLQSTQLIQETSHH